ncbi:hypothetical protein FJR41_013860 [Dolichospermum planctonicum UHCC 0167]|jgi:hypothetical protein|uniref:hypothetical protein n=1 Tax=Dolichospermum planctonicum TaxID=136072 RepID=UPI001581143C|nr:hypothetical protein [Dolichospermum planctonicum]MCW9681867.1 hypothetical protein [Dolichospermum planctonicum UHCC 0167]
MLDIKFYSKDCESSVMIQLSDELYERLAKSDFSEIGQPHKMKIEIDGEEDEIEAIDLNKGKITNRQRLIDFFKEEIVEESKKIKTKLGELPSKDEYKQQTYPFFKLIEILTSLENTEFDYLQKVT